jgi:hypothetical protein
MRRDSYYTRAVRTTLEHESTGDTVKKILVAAVLAMLFSGRFACAQKVEVSVDLSKAGAKIERNIFGQFAEHLTRNLRRRLGRSGLIHPEYSWHPQQRRRRAEGAESAERRMAEK